MKHFKLVLIALSFALLFISSHAMAQYKDKDATDIQKFGEEIVKLDDLYVRPTFENLSKLYWALNALDLNTDSHVDDYMRINECGIYRDYKFNEFEWRHVRSSARGIIAKEKDDFPVRFRIMRPMKLTDYDFEKKGFQVHKKFDTELSRRFSVIAGDIRDEICGTPGVIKDYPRGLLVELNRPFELNFIPVDEELAQLYIKETMEKFTQRDTKSQTQANVYNSRDAFLEIRVTIFAHQGIVRNGDYEGYLTNVIGAIEGFKIYADRGRKKLLYSEEMIRRNDDDEAVSKNLEDQYKEFLKKRETIKVE
jgi:hypothetical protein